MSKQALSFMNSALFTITLMVSRFAMVDWLLASMGMREICESQLDIDPK